MRASNSSRCWSLSSSTKTGSRRVLASAGLMMRSFLASEERYRLVRDAHRDNLIVPVVGNFEERRLISGSSLRLTRRRF
jgi:hypothetical protein